ncbi:nuclear pore complex protein NUP214 isoform X2 [Solanum dulcamara]|uniref:nuclear pore complex protein NUP214 isoform X2 n=1 Tax=Solanum dulcamara TaxID=45834 RepID=UPI0024865EC5|nr:nuclear pore complex protein NUP214 isoform X2 [Solanum dulcamara]
MSASIQLDEEIEGDQIGSKNYRFSKIGTPVPIKSGEDSSFDLENECPLQPLVVSERFRLLFAAHSNGFCVARTKEVMSSAEEIKEKGSGPSIQELSVVDVTIGKVSLLALSGDDSLLAACVGNTIHFFPVRALLYKDQTPAFSHSLNDSSIIKDMQWAKKAEKVYVVLSSDGKLYSGIGQSPIKEVMDDADAVGWSPDGEFIAITRKNLVNILSSKFEEKFNISLSFKSLLDDSNVKYIIKVDAVRWIRPDCIIIGCLQVNDDDEEEENYVVQVITSENGTITNPSAKPVVRSFMDVFLDFRYDAVPSFSGPHLFSSYLDQHQLAFVANRRNLDQHILLFGWSVGDAKNEAAIIEILNDNWSPKIEAQDSGDDILILGLAVDKVSQNGEIKLLLGEEEKEVSPCCLLLCLTNDGRLSIFHFASATAASVSPQSTDFEEKNDTSIVASSQDVLVESSSARKQINQVDSGLQPHEIDTGHKILSASAQSSATEKFSSEEAIKTTNQNQGANLEQSASKTSVPVDAGRVNNFRTQETQKVAEVTPGAISFSGNSLGNFFIPSIGPSTGTGSVMELPVKMTLTGFSTTSSHSSKLHISSKSDETPSSTPFSGDPRRTFDSSDRSSTANETTGTSVSIGSFKQRAMEGAGSIESLPAFPRARLQSQKGFPSEPSKPHFTRETYEAIPSKQFHDVEEMARKLHSLLEGIEGEGGFRDASISAHRSSVLALEEGIESVSEKCRIWRAVMDEQLVEVQLLLDKTVQVLARKIYMEGIFKQATDERYWDLWNRQKLSSELELKRHHVNEVNKSLTSQLIELERHFNTLELNKFGDADEIQTSKRGFQSRPGQPRNFKSLHNLRNTMTTQLAVAEQLSESLSKLMNDLSIDSPAKGQNVRKELFETIGLSYDGASYKSPVREKAVNTPFNKELSVSLAAKERSRRKQTSPVKSSEPETARRRRDSLDRNWASFEPPKTTVKRIVLQEDRQKGTASRPSLSLDKKHHQSKTRERSVTAQSNIINVSSTFSQQVRSKGLHDIPAKQSTENPFFQWADGPPSHAAEMPPMSSPVSLLQHELQLTESQYSLDTPNLATTRSDGPPSHAAEMPPMSSPVSLLQHELQLTESQYSLDTPNLATTRSGRSIIPLKDIVQTGGPKAIQQSGNRMQLPNSSSLPAQALTPIKFTIETSNVDGKPGITQPARDWKNASVTSGSTQFESNSSPIYSLPTASAANSAFTLSAKVIHSEVVNKSQGNEISFSSQASTQSSSLQSKIMPSASSSSSQGPMLSTISSTWTSFESISKASMGSNLKDSQSQSSIASLTQSSSLPSTLKLDSLPITHSSDRTRSESPTILSQPSVSILDKKADTNSDRPASLANLSTKIDTLQDSASQPVVSISLSNLQAEPLVQSNSTNKQSVSLPSANQVNPREASSQVSNVGLNTIPGQPFSASAIPPSGADSAINVKSGYSDVVTHEDEMEEEVPENSQMSVNALGNMAGFGIGTAATPVSTKPNPFGAVSPNKTSSPANSLFTSTASGGQLFRPASFSFQPIQPPQPPSPANFGAFPGSFSLTSTSQAPAVSGFGQPAQVGQGQHALGSVLGTFGQSRQLGAGIPGTGVGSANSFGRGFMSNSSAGGFGGGFSGVSSIGGGFSSLGSGGVGFGASAATSGGFAAAATSAGGFAAAATSAGGFGAAATSSGGFGASATAGGGFAAPTAVGSGFSGGGFGAFSSQQSGGSGFPAFGGSSATARPPSELFTQMRK